MIEINMYIIIAIIIIATSVIIYKSGFIGKVWSKRKDE